MFDWIKLNIYTSQLGVFLNTIRFAINQIDYKVELNGAATFYSSQIGNGETGSYSRSFELFWFSFFFVLRVS